MAKRMKMPKGFYKECKHYKFLKEKIKVIEFWLQHNTDTNKDVRFYIYWRQPMNELTHAFDYIGSLDKEEYKDHTLIRNLHQPRTRNQKAIFKSRLSGLQHLYDLVTDSDIEGMIEKFKERIGNSE